MDRVIVATDCKDLPYFKDKAQQFGLGLELQTFSSPATLTNNWLGTLERHKTILKDFDGTIGIHGAFYDLMSASLDPDVVALTLKRYRQNLRVAAELEADYVVFHLNYLGILRFPNYREDWIKRQIGFWSSFAREADSLGIRLLLENAWEDEPALIVEILEGVGADNLKACLDFAHCTLYSTRPVQQWFNAIKPHLFLCHLNNHDGKMDLHLPLNRGILDYQIILESVRSLANPPALCLEMPSWKDAEESLPLFDLPDQSERQQ